MALSTASLVLALALQAAAAEPGTVSTPPPPAAMTPAIAQPAPPPGQVRRIDDLAKPLTGAVPQGSYEESVKGAFSRTQSLQGPLDGTWTLKDAAGAGLYRLQLVDQGYGGSVEGAWSDLRSGAAATSGFLTAVVRDGGKLTVQFAEPGAGLVVANLDARPNGGFAGEMSESEAGKEAKTANVVLVRP